MRAFEFGAPSDSVRMSPAAAGSYYHDLKSTRTSQGRFDPKSTRPASSSHLRATMMCCVAARASPSIRSMGHSIIFRVLSSGPRHHFFGMRGGELLQD